MSTLTQFRHGALTFDVVDAGPRDGDVVILLHGFPERAAAWGPIAERLHAAGLRTLAPDQRGYSPGARPRRRRDYRMRLLGEDVVALIEEVRREPGREDARVHVVGHDWGAIVAWVVATLRPDLVRTLTTLSVPHPTAFTRALLTSRQGLKSWYIYLFQLPVLPERFGSSGLMQRLLPRGGMTAAEVEAFRTGIVEYGALPGGIAWYRALPFLDRELMAAKVTVPTTMVWSDGDDYVSRAAVEKCADYVDAPFELVVLEGVTHWILAQAPQPAAEAILARIGSA